MICIDEIIEKDQQRQKALELDELEELDEYEEELRDRFGPPPNEVKNLLAETRIRCLCEEAGFDQLEVNF